MRILNDEAEGRSEPERPCWSAPTRYKRCRNKAMHTITVPNPTMRDPGATYDIRCCGLHKRLHETRGWLP